MNRRTKKEFLHCAGTILELYPFSLCAERADSGIVPDNSRIAQGVFYQLLL